MLCQLLSLDKRYHIVNCFNFNRIDSYLNFEDVKTNYSSQLKLNQNTIHSSKIKYKIFNNNFDHNLTPNFNFLYKYNLLNKNYIIHYQYSLLNYINIHILAKLSYTYTYIKSLIYINFDYLYNLNFLLLMYLFSNLNICKYYYNNSSYIKHRHITLFTNIGFENLVIILKNKINFTYNLNFIKHIIIFNVIPIKSQSKTYEYIQSNYDNIIHNQIDYNTQFFYKKRNPFVLKNKFINIKPSESMLTKQLHQNYHNIYSKYYLNLQKNMHIYWLSTNKNILLDSPYIEKVFKKLPRSVLLHNNTMYLYKYNVRLYNESLFNTFDKNSIYDLYLLTQLL